MSKIVIETPNGPLDFGEPLRLEDFVEMSDEEYAELAADLGITEEEVLDFLLGTPAIVAEDQPLLRDPLFAELLENPPRFPRILQRKLTAGERIRVVLMSKKYFSGSNEEKPTEKPTEKPAEKPGFSKIAPTPRTSLPIAVRHPVVKRLPESEIRDLRAFLGVQSGIPDNFQRLSPVDLQRLFQLYNEYFFGNTLPKTEFEISDRMTATAGKCISKGSEYKIRLANFFKDLNPGEKGILNAGVRCYNRRECLQLVFEHEIIHLLIRSTPGVPRQPSDVYGPHGKLFQGLNKAYFGQEGRTHNLFREELPEDCDPATYAVGDYVEFRGKDSPKLPKGTVGRIYGINPKTVDVDFQGSRFRVSRQVLVPASAPAQEIRIRGKSDFEVGQIVSFQTQDGTALGTITKLNPKRAVVRVGLGTANVPYMNLVPTDEPPPQPSLDDLRSSMKSRFEPISGDLTGNSTSRSEGRRKIGRRK